MWLYSIWNFCVIFEDLISLVWRLRSLSNSLFLAHTPTLELVFFGGHQGVEAPKTRLRPPPGPLLYEICWRCCCNLAPRATRYIFSFSGTCASRLPPAWSLILWRRLSRQPDWVLFSPRRSFCLSFLYVLYICVFLRQFFTKLKGHFHVSAHFLFPLACSLCLCRLADKNHIEKRRVSFLRKRLLGSRERVWR